MNNRKEVINKLYKNNKKLENIIKHRQLYNFRNKIILIIIKDCITIDCVAPFVLSSLITLETPLFKTNIPFKLDTFIESANLETIDTSNGIHLSKTSYDFNYNEEIIKYSTAWLLEKDGLYKRIETLYKPNEEYNFSNAYQIFSMTKEEVDKILTKIDIKEIYQNYLLPEDYIYDCEGFVIINHTKSPLEKIYTKETICENVTNSLMYIIISLLSGFIIKKLKNKVSRNYIREKLEESIVFYSLVKEKDIETIEKVIKFNEENISLLDENLSNLEPRQFRKEKR